MKTKYSIPFECLCVQVDCSGLDLEHKNVYFPVIEAKSESDDNLLFIKKVVENYFPQYKGRIKIIKFDTSTEEKLLFLMEHFLNKYPIIIEKYPPILSQFVEKKVA